MTTHFSGIRLSSIALTAALAVTLPTVQAQEETDDPKPILTVGSRPLAVLTAASANRLKDEATFMFDTAGMPDAVDGILSVLDENVNGLQGIDWERPAGVMVYLNSVFPPSFEFVAFLPVASVEEFQSMMELGPVVMRKDASEDDRYELITPQRNIQIRMQNDYAFIQLPPMDPDPAFDRDLPDPLAMVSGLVSQFDLAVSLDVESIPKGTRDLIYNVLASTMSTQIQQRDDEPDSRYQMRKSWMQADIDGLKLMFDELKRLSIGIDVTREQGGANIDMLLDVREGSKMLEEIFASTTKPSYFTPLLSESSPVSLSWSAVMAERDRERYEGVLEGFKGELARGIEEDGDLGTVPDDASPLFHAISALQSTAREGHLDVFGQFYRDSADKLAIVGALRLQDGDAVAAGLVDFLMRIQGKGDADNIEIGAYEHAGISFHRVLIENPDAGAIELFGDDGGITFGCGPRSIWACVGGGESFDTLTGVVDELTAAYENPTDREIPASMRLVVHTTQVIDLAQGAGAANRAARAEAAAEDKDDSSDAKDTVERTAEISKKPNFGTQQGRGARRRQRRAEAGQMLQEALAEGDDRIQVEFRPTDNGMRMRSHFDLGFVRGVGRIIGSRFIEQ